MKNNASLSPLHHVHTIEIGTPKLLHSDVLRNLYRNKVIKIIS